MEGFYNIADITENMFGKEITVRARVHRARRQGKIAFVQLRQVHNFEQYFCKAVLIHGIAISLDMLKWVGRYEFVQRIDKIDLLVNLLFK